jgi:hypothetical protein
MGPGKGNLSIGGKANDFHSLVIPGTGGKPDKGGGHAIAIVGYDQLNYYYVDTCAKGMWGSKPGSPIGAKALTCRTARSDRQDSGYTDAANGVYPWVDAVTGRQHVWSVPKAKLYRLMDEWIKGGVYLKYTGGQGHAPY